MAGVEQRYSDGTVDFILGSGDGGIPDMLRIASIIAKKTNAKVKSVKVLNEKASNVKYTWARSYSAGSDCMIYRRYKGELPDYATPHACEAPAHVAAFCEANKIDVAADDELVPGRVRKVRLGTDEAA